MGLMDRPYIGTWAPNRTLVRMTPDCLVYVNGFMEIPGCRTCNRRVDLQKYITTLSVDASTDPISSATVSLQVPRHSADIFGYDGNWLLQPGLEIVILLRGYFPQNRIAGDQKSSLDNEGGEDLNFNPVNATGDIDPDDIPVYPYYQVFRGVVTQADHEFSGGFYSANLSCADTLHFWQSLYLSTNGAVYGPRPENSGVKYNLYGHGFTNMTPYSIIYTLVRNVFGAAYGVDFKLSQKSAYNGSGSVNMFKHTAEAWEAMHARHAGNLRMHGMDGTVFSGLQQAALGHYSKGVTEMVNRFVSSKNANTDKNLDSDTLTEKTLRMVGFNPTSLLAGESDGKAQTNILKMQPYALDLGAIGNPSMFGSEYMSKMDIANAVRNTTGFEFYQDVDGDLVFKPPFYNLDTSSDPVFRIEDRDLISISESSKEPDATMIKGSGSNFSNTKGVVTDDWLQPGATYIDWRLVSQFGWKEGPAFDTAYLTNPQAIFVSAINRLDMANVGMNTASISIPMRPELRAGYPVYIAHLDCFYYIKSLQHSFTFGGSCTTSITGVARRRKWLPPGSQSRTGGFPNLSTNIHLDKPGFYPATPIFVRPEDVEGNSDRGPPKAIGFPNVVLAMNADKTDVGEATVELSVRNAESIIFTLKNRGFLWDDLNTLDSFVIGTTNSGSVNLTISKDALVSSFISLYRGETLQNSDDVNQIVARLFAMTTYGNRTGVRDHKAMNALMTLHVNLKAQFAPGSVMNGQYQYYSCSHPLPEFQGPKTIAITKEALTTSYAELGEDENGEVVTLVDLPDGIGLKMGTPKNGIRLVGKPSPVPTSSIRVVSFAAHSHESTTSITTVNGNTKAQNLALNSTVFKNQLYVSIQSVFGKTPNAKNQPLESFRETFNTLYKNVMVLQNAILEVDPNVMTRADSSDYTEGNEETQDKVLNTLLTEPGGPPVWAYKRQKTKVLTKNLLEGGSYGLVVSKNFWTIEGEISQFKTKGTPMTAGTNTLFRELARPPAIVNGKQERNVIRTDRSGALSPTGAETTLDENPLENFGNKISDMFTRYVNWLLGLTKKKSFPQDADLKKIYDARNELAKLAGGGTPKEETEVTPVVTTSGSDGAPTDARTFATPVFPVSDGNGYEVYGGLPYGRGLNLAGHYDIGAAEKVAVGPNMIVGGLPLSVESMDAIERFLILYQKNNYKIGLTLSAMNASNPESAAKLAASIGAEGDSGEQIETRIQELATYQKNIMAHNAPIITSDRNQSMTGAAAAQGLAGLDVGDGEICACKGVEGSYYLQAFNGEFEAVSESNVQSHLEGLAWQTGQLWAQSRAALAGEAMDTNTVDLKKLARNLG